MNFMRKTLILLIISHLFSGSMYAQTETPITLDMADQHFADVESAQTLQDLTGQITFEIRANICFLTLGEADPECLSKADDVVHYNAKWSPNGRFLAYQATERPVGIGPVVTYVYDYEEDSQIELPLNRSLYGWSPDSAWVLVGTGRSIYKIRYDGSDEQIIVDNAFRAFAASWSPDGSHIVYLSETFPESKIVVVSVEDGLSTVLTGADLRINYTIAPIWSPDSNTIAFVVHEKHLENEWTQEIYLIDADGRHLRRLTETDRVNFEPRWSPDGTQLVFFGHDIGAFTSNSTDTSFTDIFLINADGSDLMNVTKGTGLDRYATWSPDGAWIAFASTREWDGEIYGGIFVIRPDGLDLRMITSELPLNQGGREANYPIWRVTD